MYRNILLGGVSAFALVLGLSATAIADGDGAMAIINADMNNGDPVPMPGETVSGNFAIDAGSTRINNVLNSYNGASGITHVQQNNGSNNAIQAATAAQANMTGNVPIVTGAAAFSTTFGNFTENFDGLRDNLIRNSFRGYYGVATVQQNNGDHNEIGAATAVHTNTGGFSDSTQIAVSQGASAAQLGIFQLPLLDNGSDRSNTINPSFVDASAIATVQQNNGNGNAISSATAVAGNLGSGNVNQVALAVGAVGPALTGDFSLDRDNLIQSSFTRYSGVATVQQNNGDANVLGVSTAVTANIGPGLQDGTNALNNNQVTQLAGTLGAVAGAAALDVDSVDQGGNILGFRDNTILASFGRANGVVSVQQNNGSNNVMLIASAVQANVDTGGPRNLNGNDNVNQTAVTVGGTVENSAAEVGFALTPPPSHRENLIENSFNGFSGVATVQQNNGDNNVIGAASAVVANLDGDDKTDTATSAAATAGAAVGNLADETESGANRDNLIDPSFVGATGVISVQQNNGNNNVMGVANAVVVNENNVDSFSPSASNAAAGIAQVSGNWAGDHQNTDRVNTIANRSFNNAHGVMTVQQNNGDNNVMGASNAVAMDHNGANGWGAGLSVAALNAVVTGNTSVISSTSALPGYQNTVVSSFTGASGVMTVQQNNGNNNAIQSAISVTATTP